MVNDFQVTNSVSVIIDDMTGSTPKGNQYKRNLRRHHKQLKKEGSRLLPHKYTAKDFDCLVSDIKFVDSAESHLIQVADIVAYNVYRQFVDFGQFWEEKPDNDDPTLPTYEWFNSIAHKFRQESYQNRIQGYGVVKFPLQERIIWGVKNN